MIGARIAITLASVAILGTACGTSTNNQPTVHVTISVPSYPAMPPAIRRYYIDGYNMAAGAHSLIDTDLIAGDSQSKATPTSLCKWEATQTLKPGAIHNAYVAGCLAQFAGKSDIGN